MQQGTGCNYTSLIFYVSWIADPCYLQSEAYNTDVIDLQYPIDNPGNCQQICLHSKECLFWSYNYDNKKCWRHKANAAGNTHFCGGCTGGPRYCEGM